MKNDIVTETGGDFASKELLGSTREYWDQQRTLRAESPVGTVCDFGMTNSGRERLLLPIARRTTKRIVCTDGKQTRSAMVGTGRIVNGTCRAIVRVLPNRPELSHDRNAANDR